jgi:formylglycine-generating enzyme required for sulfatase activity
MSAIEAANIQKQWAKHVGVPIEQTNFIRMKFTLIPPGEFEMGSTAAEGARILQDAKKNNERDTEFVPSEAPRHHVKITQPFYLGTYPVTQGEYQQVMGVNPSCFCASQMEGAMFKPPLPESEVKDRLRWRKNYEKQPPSDTSRHPVETVSWYDAMEFCGELSATPAERAARRVYRLPTEAEWEYACRAGTATRWYCGDDVAGLAEVAWFGRNVEGMTYPVGQKKPNPWGLYDMYRSVNQWCADYFDADYYQRSPASDPTGGAGWYRVLRGGAFDRNSWACRSASRFPYGPSNRDKAYGFRVVLGR